MSPTLPKFWHDCGGIGSAWRTANDLLRGRPATTTTTAAAATIAARLAREARALRGIRHQLLPCDSTILRVGNAVAPPCIARSPRFPRPFAPSPR